MEERNIYVSEALATSPRGCGSVCYGLVNFGGLYICLLKSRRLMEAYEAGKEKRWRTNEDPQDNRSFCPLGAIAGSKKE